MRWRFTGKPVRPRRPNWIERLYGGIGLPLALILSAVVTVKLFGGWPWSSVIAWATVVVVVSFVVMVVLAQVFIKGGRR